MRWGPTPSYPPNHIFGDILKRQIGGEFKIRF